MQPPRSDLGGMDGVAQTGQSAVVLAVTASWGLPRQSDPGLAGRSGNFSQPQATPAASWGRGTGWLTDPGQVCCESAEDSVTHLLARPSSEARQAQTRRHWPRGLDVSVSPGGIVFHAS